LFGTTDISLFSFSLADGESGTRSRWRDTRGADGEMAALVLDARLSLESREPLGSAGERGDLGLTGVVENAV
jgi:hypothetical protein